MAAPADYSSARQKNAGDFAYPVRVSASTRTSLTPAFTIADLSSVWIVANVPEEDAGELQKNMVNRMLLPALLQVELPWVL